MIHSNVLNEPVTMMFTDHVRPAKVADYEEWSAGIHGDAKRFDGFISVDVIRPGEGNGPEYTTLVKFDSCDNLKKWRDSTSLADWLEDLPDLLAKETHEQSSIGMQLWFDRPRRSQLDAEPPFWKRVIVGVVCVYPLIILLNWALGPITSPFPNKIALLFNVVILSSLLTYPVMPWVTRLLRQWLYPNPVASISQ